MDWEPPRFDEIRMDAELTSYVSDDDEPRDGADD
jgi:hypothetical protein